MTAHVAGITVVALGTLAVHRYHLNVGEAGVGYPTHSPLVTERVEPDWVVPLMTGVVIAVGNIAVITEAGRPDITEFIELVSVTLTVT